ncbi:MAG: heme exporter protein CcmD [Pseudomonadales bacterium]
MSFSSLDAFFAMGGHGLYVWLSYGAAVIIFAYNVLSVRRRRRKFFRDAGDLERRRAAAVEATGESHRS